MSDFIQLDPVVSPMDFATLEASAEVDLMPYDSKQWFGFAYNCKKGILRFKEVRQAFTYIFERQQALNANFGGSGYLISGPFTS